MKNKILFPSLFFLMITLTSCTLIGDIFKAGVWVGVLIVVVLLGLLIWAIAKYAD